MCSGTIIFGAGNKFTLGTGAVVGMHVDSTGRITLGYGVGIGTF